LTEPIEKKAELVEALRVALKQAVTFPEARGVRPADVLSVDGFERQGKLREAAEAVLGIDEDKRTFLRIVGDAWQLFRAVLPDPAAIEFRGEMIVLQVIAEMIRAITRKGALQKLSFRYRGDRAPDRRSDFRRCNSSLVHVGGG
jgi:type I restriction enzyme R subunit